MPFALPAISGLISSIFGATAFGAALQSGLASLAIFSGTAIGGAVVNLGLSLGLSFLASSFNRQKAPKPEDVQQTIKNATAIRLRHYGRVKVAGNLTFIESKAGTLYKVLALGSGRIDGIEEFWIDDNPVAVDPSTGRVTTNPYSGTEGNFCYIENRLGENVETAYPLLTATFPEWSSAHRGDGVSSAFIRQLAMKQEIISIVFPNVLYTNYRFVLRAAQVYNPTNGVTGWSDLAALVIRDYLIHPDGMRLPSGLVSTPLAHAGWQQAAYTSDGDIGLAAGGTEKRYRLWGSYSLDERPADVIGRMLGSCDGRLVPTPDGGLTLDIGTWAEPSVVIDADTITGFSKLSRGRDVMSTANVVRGTFTDPTQDYQSVEAQPWAYEDDVSERGEIAVDLQLTMSPSPSQARRLMKLHAYRSRPKWIATFQCNLRAMAAFGKRFVRVTYPALGVDEVMEVQDLNLIVGEGSTLLGVTLTVQSMPSAAYQWNPATEEGGTPASDSTTVDNAIPVATGLGIAIEFLTTGGVTAPYAILSFDPPPSAALSVQARGRLVTDTAWTPIAVEPGATMATGPLISDIGVHEYQIRYVSIAGRQGEWTNPSIKIVATASLDFRYPANSQYLAALV